MLPEERNHRVKEVLTSPNDVTEHVFPMIVVPTIRDYVANAEELTKGFEARAARFALRHRELVRDLETGSVADAARPAWLPDETDREASFSVYKTDHPATELDQSFLLIFRTRHVVTMVNALSDATLVVRDTRVFQHIARCAPHHCWCRGQRIASRDYLSLSATLP